MTFQRLPRDVVPYGVRRVVSKLRERASYTQRTPETDADRAALAAAEAKRERRRARNLKNAGKWMK